MSWRSRKQTIVVASSCEAEYVAAFSATQEAVWLGLLLTTLHQLPAPPNIVLHLDNQGSIPLTATDSINQRNKHVDIKFHFTREQVLQKTIYLR